MTTPIFDAVATQYPGIHRASNLFPQPAPEPHITFIKERGAWQDIKGVVRGAALVFLPSKAPEVWP